MERHNNSKQREWFNKTRNWRYEISGKAHTNQISGSSKSALFRFAFSCKSESFLQKKFWGLNNFSTFQFQYTDTHRTQDSYQAYIEGLFNDRAYLVHASVQPDDLLIGVRR